MITSYALINTESIDPVVVGQALTFIDEVDNVHQISGEYDFIVRIISENLIELREHSLKKIENVRGVSKVTSLILEEDQTL